jgi:hypothetical protein
MTFSEIFWSSVVTTASGIVLALLAACYKSKCRTVSLFCGALELTRDVDIEMQEDKIAMGLKSKANSPANSRQISFINPPSEPHQSHLSLDITS